MCTAERMSGFHVIWLSVAAVLLSTASQALASGVAMDVLIDSRIPDECSSPGWVEAPYDISVLLGGYVYFNCRSSMTHSNTTWLYEGRRELTAVTSKVMIFNRNSSLRFGPVGYNDDGLSIGCEVLTEFGKLPSSLGRITVKTQPHYSPRTTQVAIVGQPFDFDFNFTGTLIPTSFQWTKNGQPFQGDGERVMVDHTGILFIRVLQRDAGQYRVVARSSEGTAQAYSILIGTVTYWFTASHVQTGSSSRPTLSTRLAVTLALHQNRSKNASSQVKTGGSGAFHISSSNTAAYAMQVIRTLLQRPSSEAVLQGRARLRSETILRRLFQLIGIHQNATFTFEDIKKITNCTAVRKRFNCHSRNVLRYRTADGTCNNFFYPLNGAALTAFARLLPAAYEDGISRPVGHGQFIAGDPFSPPWPSARLVSWKIVRNLPVPNTAGLTHMFMQWGQFLDHDLDLTPMFNESDCGCNYTEMCFPIRVKPEDSVFGVGSSHRGECIPFSRSLPACQCRSVRDSFPRNQINQITSYIDGSNVYGSSDKLARSLRLFKGGLLKQGGRLDSFKGNLPFQEEKPRIGVVPFFVAGDERANEQTGLTVMHTLWMREHNRIARKLAEINRCWDDETLYQEARKIVGGQMQAITFKQFLPILFGSHMATYIPRYRGYNPFVDATIPNSFATAAFRFGHSLIRAQLLRLDKNFRRIDIGPLPLSRAFFNPLSYFESGGTDALARGLTVDRSNPVDEFLNRVLTSQLFTTSSDSLGSDLAALNIMRGRDHGIPAYRTWQRLCEKLFPGKNATFSSDATERTLRDIYGDEGFRNGIDLWVGGLAETRLPGAQVGPTFACILGITFSRLRDGDRFWYQNPYTFTPAQRRQIHLRTSLSKVVCTNGNDIPEIQRSVFHEGEQRVNCSSIPEVNLWRWWDRRCINNFYYGFPYNYYRY